MANPMGGNRRLLLSIVKDVMYPANVRRYMERLEQTTGVGLHFDKAR